MRRPNIYSESGLDRANLRRRDQDWLERRLHDPASALLPLWRGMGLIAPTEAPALVLLEGVLLEGGAARRLVEAAEWALLGLRGEQAVFALDVSRSDDPVGEFGLAGHGRFADLRQVGPLMERREAALVAYARGLMLWHQRHGHCGVCGAPTRAVEGGHQRLCTDPACAAVHFPRTDPAVIMLVTSGERALLGRQRAWPPGMHSTLAGFVEPGESLEEAVRREVMEEVGIAVGDVRYHSSQPWPFPSSIMLGFTALALEERIVVDPHELESAAWFDKAELRASPEDDRLRLPRRDSIARRLIEDWLADDRSPA